MRYLTFILSLLIAVAIKAQETQPFYVQVDYMKPFDGKTAEYVSMEQNIYKPIHQQRIQSGEIVAWQLYEVRYPSGTGTEYDYVTVTIFANFASMDDDVEEYSILVGRAHPDISLAEVEQYAIDSRKLVRSEVFKSIEFVRKSGMNPASSLLVDYMNVSPTRESEYLRMERMIWKPMHEDRMAQGNIKSWALYELLFPGGLNYPYSHATVTGFDGWEQISDSWPDGIWERVHPSATQEDLENRANEVRDLVSTQIWKLIDFVIMDQ